MKKRIMTVAMVVSIAAASISTLVGNGSIKAKGAEVTGASRARHTDLRVDSTGELTVDRERVGDVAMGQEDSWTVFVYLCGSDLESQYNSASDDIKEMIEASEKDNVNIIIQTGGSTRWNKPAIPADGIGRFTIEKNSLELIESHPDADMGDYDTFKSFLKWGVKKYPAEHMGVILWNHGGGSFEGVCYDEKNEDSLQLPELEKAFYETSKGMTDRFEFIGFDACLMATLETANILAPYADYMIASENEEPSTGWNYKELVNQMVANPDIDGKELGKTIVDAYMDESDSYGDDYATLSVVDMTKIDDILVSYNDVMKDIDEMMTSEEAINDICANGEDALAEGVGYDYGSTVDMKNFIDKLPNSIASKDILLNRVKDAIVYERHSKEITACGLSSYVPLMELDMVSMNIFRNVAASPYAINISDKIASYVLFLEKDMIKQGYITEDYEEVEGKNMEDYVQTPYSFQNYIAQNWQDSEYYFEDHFDFVDYMFMSSREYVQQKDNEYYFDKDFDDIWYDIFY